MAKLKATPKNYAEALEVLNGKSSMRLGNNTYLENHENGVIAVRLHNTNIVVFYAHGRVELYSGGYQTVTTKERMNQFIAGRVIQSNWTWRYVYPHFMGGENVAVPFEDGMFITNESNYTNVAV